MTRRFEPLAGVHLPLLGGPCRQCVEWQLDPAVGTVERPAGADALQVKAAWLDRVRAEHGGVGWVAVVDDAVVGHVLYAPPVAVPRVEAMPTAPVSSDAVLLVGLWAEQPMHYKPLLQRALKDLRARETAALEAFGGGQAPRGCQTSRAVGTVPCRFPEPLLTRLGFRCVREHRISPRYRIDVGSVLAVLDQLEHGVTGLARALRPVRAAEPGLGRPSKRPEPLTRETPDAG